MEHQFVNRWSSSGHGEIEIRLRADQLNFEVSVIVLAIWFAKPKFKRGERMLRLCASTPELFCQELYLAGLKSWLEARNTSDSQVNAIVQSLCDLMAQVAEEYQPIVCTNFFELSPNNWRNSFIQLDTDHRIYIHLRTYSEFGAKVRVNLTQTRTADYNDSHNQMRVARTFEFEGIIDSDNLSLWNGVATWLKDNGLETQLLETIITRTIWLQKLELPHHMSRI